MAHQPNHDKFSSPNSPSTDMAEENRELTDTLPIFEMAPYLDNHEMLRCSVYTETEVHSHHQ